ncbi:MAG: CAP domain-containing protein [Chloroflexota bacterium]|nr:CAP domain-containing protein [Chloroflexota bacterium]
MAAPQPVQAQASAAWEVLAEINAYRAANGLDPLIENQYLNISAQNHVNWMAETGIYSHTGIDGSTSTDRAIAAGYGEGSSVRVTENWARGPGMTASEVVYQSWATSSIHNSQMLTTSYNEFGAGVALDGDGMTVYVVNFGLVLGNTNDPQPTTSPSTGPSSTPAPIIQPLVTSTPNPDGSVIHIVQYGETLWTIVEAYNINMPDLLALNGLTEEDAIFPDQQLLIKPASIEVQETPETTGTPAELTTTPSLAPSPTAATMTSAPSPTLLAENITETPEPRTNFIRNIFSGDTLLVGIGLVVVSVLGIALLLFTSSRLK